MQLIPKDAVVEAKSTPLEVTDTKATEMLAKAKELHTRVMEGKELMDLLENYYIFEKNEHYTSKQLKAVVDSLYAELNPEPEPELTKV
jgi:hypothetical protein